MKKIILFWTFFVLIIFAKGQSVNKMIFSIKQWNKTGDSLEWYNDTINFSVLKDNNWINANLATKMVELFNTPRLLNPEDKKILINQFFAQTNGWSTATINLLTVGDYSNTLNINQRNLHKLYFASQTEYLAKRYEMLIRIRHELEARTTSLMNNLIGMYCIGWS